MHEQPSSNDPSPETTSCDRSPSRCRTRRSRICVDASPAPAGPLPSSCRMMRRACSSPRYRQSCATGQPSTNCRDRGQVERRYRSSSPRSTAWTSTSCTCDHVTTTALPLIITQGWPGSVIELLEVVGPLTDPTAHGGRRGGRLPSGVAVASWLRVLRGPECTRLGSRKGRAGVGDVDDSGSATPAMSPKVVTSARASPSTMAQQMPSGLVGIQVELPQDPAPRRGRCARQPGPGAHRHVRRGTGRVRGLRCGRTAADTLWSRVSIHRPSATR